MKQLIAMAGVVYAACLLADAEPVIVYNETVGGVSPVRQLVNAITGAVDGATIRIKQGTYTFGDEDYSDTLDGVKNLLRVKVSNLTIEGETATSRTNWTDRAEPVVIDANGKGRIFYFNSGKSGITVRNLALTGANTSAGTGSTGKYGGGAYGASTSVGNVVFSNCVFRQIVYGSYGAAYNVTLRDCCVTNCSATTSTWYAFKGVAHGCDFVSNMRGAISDSSSAYDCRFVGNYRQDGAAIGVNCSIVSNCVCEANTGSGNSSGFSGNTQFFDCQFTSNACVGAVLASPAKVVDCRFEENSGGAISRNTAGSSWIEHCTFLRNRVGQYANGGAIRMQRTSSVKSSMVVTNCWFEGNRGGYEADNSNPTRGSGGAICNDLDLADAAGETPWDWLKVYDSTFVTNTSLRGAGVCGVHAVRCKFDCNIKTNPGNGSQLGCDAWTSFLEDCELTGGEIADCVASRCTIHSITNTDRSIFYQYVRATNCIVRNCGAETGDLPELYGTTAVLDAEFVNCTFVTNRMNTYDLVAGIKTTNSVKFINCLFNGNRNATLDSDVIAVERGAKALWSEFAFENTYYGKFAPGVLSSASFATKTGEGLLMQCEDPKFAKDAHANVPYWSLSLKSPLLGKGAYADWMENATDLAGRPRLRDGGVDVGCYQCWLTPLGFMLMFR